MLQKLILWAFTSVALLSACASNPLTSPDDPAKAQPSNDQQKAQFAGFLRDYPKLQPVADDDALRWVDPNTDIAAYDKILLERIQATLKDSSDYKAVDPTELKALVDYFHQALVRELGEAYPIVSVSGPGVLRVRIAITNLVPAQKELSVVALVIPYATIADLGSGAASGRDASSTTYVGETGIEKAAC